MKICTLLAGACVMLAVGTWMGLTVHGPSLQALLMAFAGAAAGYGMTGALWQIVELRRVEG